MSDAEFLSVLDDSMRSQDGDTSPVGIPSRFRKKNHRRMYHCKDPIRQLLVLQLLSSFMSMRIFKMAEFARAVANDPHNVLICVHAAGVNPTRQGNL